MSKTLNGLHIEGRRWFRKTAGNTYTSARIYANGQCIAMLGPDGGYGDYYLQIALDWLEENGYITRKHYTNGGMEGGTYFVREKLGGTYSVIDVPREKDL